MKHTSLAMDKFISHTHVSRETLEKMIVYHDLLLKWQKKINLISASTLSFAWERHFLDSAQLFDLLPAPDKSIFDFGSGAGFPGLVLSLMGVQDITLIESDHRKCIFLSEVIRATGATAKVYNGRIESMAGRAQIITSRACASLDQLLTYAAPLLAEDGHCLFLKGKGADEEVKEAEKRWTFHVEHFPSIVDSEGAILRVAGIEKK